MNRYALTFLLLLPSVLAALPTCADLSESDLRKLQDRVVQIEATLPTGGEVGSGILVSRRQDFLYILTAEHVVRQGFSDAEEVRLRFHFWREDYVPAEVLPFSEGDLDLALLRVDMAEAPFLRPHVEDLAEVAHGGEARLARGDRLVPVGNPQGRPWYTPVDPPPVMGVTGSIVNFEYNCEGGASGGAIFDERGRLRGLIQQYDGKLCYALAFPVIRQVVEGKWGIPLNLLAGPPPPGADDGPRVVVAVELADPGRSDLASLAAQSLRGTVAPITGLKLAEDGTDPEAVEGPVLVLRARLGPVQVNRRKFKGYGVEGVADHSSLDIGLELVEPETGKVRYSQSFEGRNRRTYNDPGNAPETPEDRGSDLVRDALEQARESLTTALVEASGR